MNLLLVNDDGIDAAGIRAMIEALVDVGDVYVSAPDRQRSAGSHSLTIGKKVFVEERKIDGVKGAIATSGTPADCTKLGIQLFGEQGIKFDAVISGINMGSNLGNDTIYSGTVGAALEASMDGIHAMAVSVDSHNADQFQYACDLVKKILPQIGKIDSRIALNINTPNLPQEDIKGTKVTVLGPRYYNDSFVSKDEAYELQGNPDDYSDMDLKYDVACAHNGYASITPLTFDLTAYDKAGEVCDLEL